MPVEGKIFFARIIDSTALLGKVPTRWKLDITVPVPKPGKSHHRCEGYRPVSLTSVCCKVAERVILGVLMRYIALSDRQAGYRKFRGTEDNVAAFTAAVESAFTRGKHVVAVFIDLKSAFERVDHESLIELLIE